MQPLTVAAISSACIFGGSILGLLLRNVLPDHHLQDDSKDTVKIGPALIAALVALVLGILVGSAKNTYDAVNGALKSASAKILLLDPILSDQPMPVVPC